MCVAISKILLEGLGQIGGGDSMCVAISKIRVLLEDQAGLGGVNVCCYFEDRGPAIGPGWIRGGSMCVAVSKIGVLL